MVVIVVVMYVNIMLTQTDVCTTGFALAIGYSQAGYDQYSGYSDPNTAYGGYDYSQAAPDPYAAGSYAPQAASSGYGSYGGASGW